MSIHILHYIIISGVQRHVSAYIEATIRLHCVYRRYKFNNSQVYF